MDATMDSKMLDQLRRGNMLRVEHPLRYILHHAKIDSRAA